MALSDNEKERLKTCVQKKDLIHGAIYMGDCRNAFLARWNADMNIFVYIRQKWGSSFLETIRHPEDDDGHDLFWPEMALQDFKIPESPEEKKFYESKMSGEGE